MGRVFLVIALCLGLTAPVAAAESEPLSADETAIQFDAPGLVGVSKTFRTNSRHEGFRVEVGVWVDRGLPIRLTPMTATCRVPPLSRVKLGIGWSRGVARDAEQ